MEKSIVQKEEKRENELREKELREKRKKEKYDSLLAYTNPVIICDVSYFKDDVEVALKNNFKVQVDDFLWEDKEIEEFKVLCEITCDTLYKSLFVVMPMEELYIKEL